MSSTTFSKEQFWSTFFGEGNEISIAWIKSGRLSPEGQQYLARIERQLDQNLHLPVILPAKRTDREQRGATTWYAFAPDYREFRTLGMELRAALGKSYSDFEPRSAQLDLSDPLESAVAVFSGNRAYRFRTRQSDFDSVIRALNVQYELWESAPERQWDIRRPTSKILREFEFALLALDGKAAESCIEELAALGGIEAHNLSFMRIRRLSALGREAEILALEDLESLLAIRRPGQISDAILAAVWERYWIWHQTVPEFGQLRARMDEEVRPRYESLLRTGRTPLQPNARKLLVWDQVTRDTPRARRIQDLIDSCSATAEREFLKALSTSEGSVVPGEHRFTLPEEEPAEVNLRANDMLDRGDSDHAFELALGQKVSPARTALLFRCALDLQTPESASKALESFELLGVEDQERLREHRWVSVSMPLLESQRVGVPGSWVEWLESAEMDVGAVALDRLDQAIASWTSEGLYMTVDEAARVSQHLIASRSPEAQQTIIEAVPKLIEFAIARCVDTAGVDALFDAAFDLLSIESDLRHPELDALAAVFEYQLTQGMSATRYDERTATLLEIWEEVQSPLRSNFAISLIGSVTYSPAPDREAMVRLVAGLTDSLRRMGSHLDRAEHSLIVDALSHAPDLDPIAVQFRKAAEISIEEEPDWWNELAGRSIGIYSLLEASTRAAVQTLHGWLPDLDVRVNHDKVATPALDSLAREVDILVVSWASAKHSATQRIRSLRPEGLPLLWAAGTGSTSIVRALKEMQALEAN